MYEKYKKDFPNITEQELMDLKMQFQTFDLNMDGLIDYNELGQVLDDLGDKSSIERRRQYFEDMDADGSGAIDFEVTSTTIGGWAYIDITQTFQNMPHHHVIISINSAKPK